MKTDKYLIQELDEVIKKLFKGIEELKALKTVDINDRGLQPVKEVEPEIEYPIYAIDTDNNSVWKFISSNIHTCVISEDLEDIGETLTNNLISHADINWQILDYDKETGFYDGQPVWVWDNGTQKNIRYYNSKNKSSFDGYFTRNGFEFDNYEAINEATLKSNPFIFEGFEKLDL